MMDQVEISDNLHHRLKTNIFLDFHKLRTFLTSDNTFIFFFCNLVVKLLFIDH